MNRFLTVVICFFCHMLFSASSSAAQIDGAADPKNLSINCGNQEQGLIGLVVDGTRGKVTLNNEVKAASVKELPGGSYQIRVPEYEGIFVILDKDSLQATSYYDAELPPYMLAFKRVNCTWGRN